MSPLGSIRRLPSKNYQARYTYRGAKYKAPETFKTRRSAIAWLAEEEKLIALGVWTPPKQRAEEAEKAARREASTKITLGEWLIQYHEGLRHGIRPIKESTLHDYLKAVNNRILRPLPPSGGVGVGTKSVVEDFAVTPLAGVTKSLVHKWWDDINRAYPTPTTNQKAYKRLRAALSAAVEQGLIDHNPCYIKAAGGRINTKDKYLPTDAELAAIMEHMPARYRALTSLVLFHGLRIGEAVALEQQDVQVVGEVPCAPRIMVTIRQNAQRLVEQRAGRPHTYLLWQSTKTASGRRSVPIMGSHTRYFLEHMADYPARECLIRTEDGPRTARLFTSTRSGAPIMDTSYRSILNRAEEIAGVTTEIDPHCGRNWLITRLAEQGAHLKEIGKILGQTDLETITNIYMKVRAGRTETLMNKVDLSLEYEK